MGEYFHQFLIHQKQDQHSNNYLQNFINLRNKLNYAFSPLFVYQENIIESTPYYLFNTGGHPEFQEYSVSDSMQKGLNSNSMMTSFNKLMSLSFEGNTGGGLPMMNNSFKQPIYNELFSNSNCVTNDLNSFLPQYINSETSQVCSIIPHSQENPYPYSPFIGDRSCGDMAFYGNIPHFNSNISKIVPSNNTLPFKKQELNPEAEEYVPKCLRENLNKQPCESSSVTSDAKPVVLSDKCSSELSDNIELEKSGTKVEKSLENRMSESPLNTSCPNKLFLFLGCDDSDSDQSSDYEGEDGEDWESVDGDSGYKCELFEIEFDDAWNKICSGNLALSNLVISDCEDQTDNTCRTKPKEGVANIEHNDLFDSELSECCLAVHEANLRWKEHIEQNISIKSPSKVSFSNCVKIKPMCTWTFASRAARKGPWEQYARDRMWFQRRIKNVEPILTKVLEPNHRQLIYNKFLSTDS